MKSKAVPTRFSQKRQVKLLDAEKVKTLQILLMN